MDIKRILRESVAIPNSEWRIHPAVPVELIKRHPVAQRPSPLERFKRIAGPFDPAKAGLPRIVPNGGNFYAVTGATRVEYAAETLGKKTTLPCEVFPREKSIPEMAEFFLDESVHTEPSIRVWHGMAVVAQRKDALFVQKQKERLPGADETYGAFYFIVGRKDGEALLERTVTQLLKIWPFAGAASSRSKTKYIPGCVVRGMALLIEAGEAPKKKWKHESPLLIQAEARNRKSRRGGIGSMSMHAAAIMCGKEI